MEDDVMAGYQESKLPAIGIHRKSALGETAKFFTFMVHETLRNVMFTESLAEFSNRI